jgi:hypothetical protein
MSRVGARAINAAFLKSPNYTAVSHRVDGVNGELPVFPPLTPLTPLTPCETRQFLRTWSSAGFGVIGYTTSANDRSTRRK